MKKNTGIIIGVIAIIIIAIIFVIRGLNSNNTNNNQQNKEETKYTATELLDKVVEKAKEKNEDLKKLNLKYREITSENLKDVLGITEEEYKNTIESAMEYAPADGWFTESYVVVKVKSGQDVDKLARKIVTNTEPARFGCLKPEVITGIYLGNYIMLIDSHEQGAKDLISSFKEIMGEDATTITRDNDWSSGGLAG